MCSFNMHSNSDIENTKFNLEINNDFTLSLDENKVISLKDMNDIYINNLQMNNDVDVYSNKNVYTFLNKSSLYAGVFSGFWMVLSGAAIYSSPMARESSETMTIFITSSSLALTSGIIYYLTRPKRNKRH